MLRRIIAFALPFATYYLLYARLNGNNEQAISFSPIKVIEASVITRRTRIIIDGNTSIGMESTDDADGLVDIQRESQLTDQPSAGIETLDAQGLIVEVARTEHDSVDTTGASSLKQTKIINGIPAERSSYAFIVRFHSSNPSPNSFYCGGTLISPDVILTAAHCIDGETIFVDIYSLEDQATNTYNVVKSVVHPNYDRSFFGHDFALIKIDGVHVQVNTMAAENGIAAYWELVNEYDWEANPPIMRLHRYDDKSTADGCTSLSRAESKQVTTLTVAGYGRTSFPDGPISYSSLQSADVHYLSNEQCNEMYLKAPPHALANKEKGKVITNDMLCANDNEEKQDACSGDSGGPLLAKLPNGIWSLVGIISWGIGCAHSKYPGVYSRVASEIDWIEATVCDQQNGLSPLSCIANRDGIYQLRDYAYESLVNEKSKKLLQRRPASLQVRRKRVHLNLSFSTADLDRQSPVNRLACELMEGVSMTSSPTLKPTARPEKSRPSKVGIGMNINCRRNNQSNVKYFVAENNKVKDCEWVKRKCRRRCDDYSFCCPETCNEKVCQR